MVCAMTDLSLGELADREPLVTRIFRAPRGRVFGAWADPDLVAKWWGPAGFDTPRETVTIEPRVGGRYDLRMVQADNGESFWVRNEIIELIEPVLLVLRSAPMPEFGRPEPVITRVQFRDVDGGTHLTLHRPYPEERRDSARAGWNSSFDKLAALLGESA